MKTSLFLFCLCFSYVSYAHQGGHGAPIAGVGSHGGKLVPVILAKDAGLGARAKTQAVAEWEREGMKLKVYFWKKDRSGPLLLQGKEVKWIFLGKTKVLNQRLHRPTSKLRQTIPFIKETKAIEVVLPGLQGSAEKHVFLMDLTETVSTTAPSFSPH